MLAEVAGNLAGAVAYLGPHAPKAEFFRPEWSVMRMLVVHPAMRGRGLGRMLSAECQRRAGRDRAAVLALHTSDVMRVALSMYRRMGFKRVADAPPVHGVEYGVYLKELATDAR